MLDITVLKVPNTPIQMILTLGHHAHLAITVSQAIMNLLPAQKGPLVLEKGSKKFQNVWTVMAATIVQKMA